MESAAIRAGPSGRNGRPATISVLAGSEFFPTRTARKIPMVMIVMSATAPAMIGASFRPSSCLSFVADDPAVPGNAGANGSRKMGSGGEIVVAMGLGGETTGGGISSGGANGEGTVGGADTMGAPEMLVSGAADSSVFGDNGGAGAKTGAGGKGVTTADACGAGHSIRGRASASFATS